MKREQSQAPEAIRGCRFFRNPWFSKRTGKERRRQNNSGQIIIEYVLLLLIAVSVAAVMTRLLINRDKDSPGILIKGWQAIVTEIGKDKADDTRKPSDPPD